MTGDWRHMTRLIMVRHGESETNLAGRLTGQLDVDLTPEGRAQAAETAAFILGKYRIDRIVSSDLRRAADTARPVADTLGLEIETDSALREMDMGLWQGLAFGELRQKYAESWNRWREDITEGRPDGGESIRETAERVYRAVDGIVSRYEGENVLITTHAAPVRIMICRALGWPLGKIRRVDWVGNASVTEIVCEDGNWRFVSYTGTVPDGSIKTLYEKDFT